MTARFVDQLRNSLASSDPTPDGELLRRYAADRDALAFDTLVRRHADCVWRICRSELPHDVHAAEDAFQATFLAVIRQADRIRGNVPAWLHILVRP